MLFKEEEDGFPEGLAKRERSYSRTMSVTSNADVNAYVKKAPRRLCGFPVKHGVSRWNLLAIVMTPLCVMLISTYLNA